MYAVMTCCCAVRLSTSVIRPPAFVKAVTHSEALSPSAGNTITQHKIRLSRLEAIWQNILEHLIFEHAYKRAQKMEEI